MLRRIPRVNCDVLLCADVAFRPTTITSGGNCSGPRKIFRKSVWQPKSPVRDKLAKH